MGLLFVLLLSMASVGLGVLGLYLIVTGAAHLLKGGKHE